MNMNLKFTNTKPKGMKRGKFRRSPCRCHRLLDAVGELCGGLIDCIGVHFIEVTDQGYNSIKGQTD
jgi:hypothetical protein